MFSFEKMYKILFLIKLKDDLKKNKKIRERCFVLEKKY